jgi:hypothetical protein
MCLFDFTHASGQPLCSSADPVRFRLNGVEYHVPAALQPTYSPAKAVPTQDYFLEGTRAKRYCQRHQDPPAVVDSIAFPQKSLGTWARVNADRSELEGVFPLVIERAARSSIPTIEGGENTSDGLFRRIARGRRLEIVSIEPVFFGGRISADCGPDGTQQPSSRCTIWGRLPDGSLVTLGVRDSQKPIDAWPHMLQQVEAFISSLAGSTR